MKVDKKKYNEKKKYKYYYSVKFIIVGNQSVGKTNIIHRFTKGEYQGEYISTIGMDFISHNIELDNNVINIQIWDTAGTERYRSVTKGYYSNSTCAIIVYDITNIKSFDSVKEWIEECKSYTNPNILLILAGNKSDLSEERGVTEEEGKELANQYGMTFFESSAKDGKNINEIFINAIKKIIENINNKLYDLNDPSNGIKKCEMEDDFNIDKTIKTSFSNQKLDKSNHLKKKKRNKC